MRICQCVLYKRQVNVAKILIFSIERNAEVACEKTPNNTEKNLHIHTPKYSRKLAQQLLYDRYLRKDSNFMGARGRAIAVYIVRLSSGVVMSPRSRQFYGLYTKHTKEILR